MRLLPQSLFGRLLAGLLAVVGVALLAVVGLIVHERRDVALWTSTVWDAADNIASASTELVGLDAHERQARVEAYRAQLRPLVERRPPPRPRREVLRLQQAFADKIRMQLGPEYKVTVTNAQNRWRDVIPLLGNLRPPPDAPEGGGPPAFRSPDNWYDVTVRLPDGDEIVFRTLAPHPGPPLPKQIFINLGLLTALLAVVLYLMTRSITRPLSDLAQAADAVGRGENQLLPERGAKELRDATHAFNTMQERLRRYLDSRTRVVAAMSHDLRTPLTRLRLRAEALDDDEARSRFVADIDEMSRMVTGALNMFKGLNDEEPARQVIVDDVLAAIQQEFAELGVPFAIEGHSDAPILGKEQSLKRCLSNLLNNAVKYGSNVVARVSDDDELVITIQDEGPGIPAEELERVFEPFYRVEASRNRDTGGTGLGLSIARDIAQAHGGSIVLRNHPGGGLEAIVRLPRAKVSVAPDV
ncbi:MAG TPA: HAMP domain-containing sensor histidine kinase [Povalibacter sp.]|uniref:sensor histidine kinase n=1 Tax=Povalibacter sp. TaxID=1962978 RepID=UPI002B6A01C2|nr:HAMP domain-containing sensor histidine kinase [Povalibacter sp.]HMN44387.1 HAMP domain-containing sensor histidine kinase [Povalibacter sp.]